MCTRHREREREIGKGEMGPTDKETRSQASTHQPLAIPIRRRTHLDDPADLLVTADDGVELGLLRVRHQVVPVLLERLLGRLVGWLVVS